MTYREVLAVREIRWLWLAHVLSVAGDQLARVALTVLVYDRTASAGLSALTYAVSYVPDLVGGALLAGIADRYSRRTVMVVTDLARAALVACMAVPGLHLGVQVALLIGVQLLAAPFSAARQATLPTILRGDALTVGIGLMSITYQIALVLGFGAGASIVALLGHQGALLTDAVTFVASALIIRWGLAEHRPAADNTTAGRRRGHSVIAGWRLVLGHRRLRILLVIACLSGFYVVPEGLAVPTADELGAGTSAAGWLLAANPIGTVLGMAVLKRLPPDRRLALLGPLAVLSSLVLVPTGWQPPVLVVVLLWTASGAASAHDIVTQATFVAEAPDEQRGHAVGVAIASLRSAQGAGIIVGGLAAQASSPSLVIAVVAAIGSVVAVGAWAAWSRAAASEPDTVG